MDADEKQLAFDLVVPPEMPLFRAAIRIGDDKFGLSINAANHKEARRSIVGFYPEARAVLVRIK